jgi:hypothetical protein
MSNVDISDFRRKEDVGGKFRNREKMIMVGGGTNESRSYHCTLDPAQEFLMPMQQEDPGSSKNCIENSD